MQVVGNKFDTENVEPKRTYELIDQLLGDLSPAFRQSFGNLLCEKLEEVRKQQNNS